ncbi:DUF7667 family protein [Paenibacillus antibioticophila]|nr:hypothetical protein [Paenibacillus antibioticophila]
MAIMVHPVHRNLAHLYQQILAGTLSPLQVPEFLMMLRRNMELVQEVDGYKEAAYAGQVIGNMDLVQHFAAKLDEMEAKYT